jgi:hypothetical protein
MGGTVNRIILIAAALLAGFVGGAVGTVVMQRPQTRTDEVIRARGFELLDEAGRVVAYWGIDKGQNAVLAFASHWPKAPRGGGVVSDHPPLPLDDPENQRAAIGVIDDSPFLIMRGSNGKELVGLGLSAFGKPAMWMSDETGPRLHLGVQGSDTPGPEDNDWGFALYPDMAWLGMHTEKQGGHTYVSAGFSINKNKIMYPYGQPK